MSDSAELTKSLNSGDYLFQLRGMWKRIQVLQVHLKKNKKDYYSKLSLARILAKRRRFLNYLREHSPQDYQIIVKEHLASKGKVAT
ncbi:uS15 family ribosomal protein [Candidatus Mycoplasma haematominutum]|uniref:30S ribosomal protein S15 n=1 Tax=Candidatus Mycoplasma haematominutum 'Birmingham 1' TaxID=1116213 RepID=G8C2N8_9MOLU|nr:uS15 family ribosomal protein [Candidatus Mycoplasma haematominutum]CCE66586.1 ribosomal protein S15 [Candidatus Mycoplasma haematominutum 'Birmingham 1']